jgi:Kinesin motor domain
MMGAEVADGCKMGRDTGIIPRFGFSLFERIIRGKLNASIEVSYFEIYNEKIHDLLSDDPGPRQPKPSLRVREHPQFGPYVENLTVQSISSFDSLQVTHFKISYRSDIKVRFNFVGLAATWSQQKSHSCFCHERQII